MNLNPFSTKSLPNSQLLSWLSIVFLAVALIGFADAAFLSAKHYSGGPIPCAILNDCETVTTSRYSEILDIPVSLLGAIYYITIAVLTLAYLDSRNYKLLSAAIRLTVIGLVASAYFLFLQIFVLKALCFYCLISAITSATLFIFGLYLKSRRGG